MKSCAMGLSVRFLNRRIPKLPSARRVVVAEAVFCLRNAREDVVLERCKLQRITAEDNPAVLRGATRRPPGRTVGAIGPRA